VPHRAEITAATEPGVLEAVTLHDGSVVRLRAVAGDYDVHDRVAAMNHLAERQAEGEIVTGLLYVEPDAEDLHERLHTVETPLNRLTDEELCPGAAALAKVNAALR